MKTVAQQIVDVAVTDSDVKIMSEHYAAKVKFHSTFTEYVFEDESTIIQDI